MQYIGAKDRIDQLLVKKYADLRMNNLTDSVEIPVDRFWKLMNIVAQYEKAIISAKPLKQAK